MTISYSCDRNIKTIINPHDAKILYPIISTEQRECNFLNKDTCPLEQKCHTINVVYKAKSNMKPSKLSRKVCFGLRAKPPVKTISQCIQFHWQFLITNSGFWLVNMLWKFDTLSKKKEMVMIPTQIFWWKPTKRYQKRIYNHKVAFFTLNSPH